MINNNAYLANNSVIILVMMTNNSVIILVMMTSNNHDNNLRNNKNTIINYKTSKAKWRMITVMMMNISKEERLIWARR